MNKLMIVLATLVVAVLFLVPCRAYADVGACFNGCRTLINGLPDDSNLTPDEQLDRCVSEVSACADLDTAAMQAVQGLCHSLRVQRVAVRPWHAAEPTPSFCFLPNGATVDDARHRCRCPVGTIPLRADPRRSADRLRSFGVPPGREVYLCADPLAPRSAPGSYENRSTDIESWAEESHVALQALCHPGIDGGLVEACRQARDRFLEMGTSDGPVDLGPLNASLANLIGIVEGHQQELERLAVENERQDADMLGTREMISTLSGRVDVLTECIHRGVDHRITYTDSTGVTGSYRCPEILAAASRDAVERATAAAREEARRVVRETVSPAFVLVQGYGLVSFNALDVDNTHYGLPWQIGGELTLGVGLGGAWNFHGGIGVARGGPRIPGVTTTAGEARLGLGVWVARHVQIGFGLMAAHRFLMDARAVHSIYGGYVDVMFRFMPDREWSPVLTIRGLVGATPRNVAQRWEVQADGGFLLLLGFGHF